MKRLALLLLVSLLCTYLLATRWMDEYPWLTWVRAFAEAGSVGAVADWFAVTALFRRPLGIPVPHTAIIPRKRDQIGEALGRFVETNLLTPANLMGRFRELDVLRVGADWLRDRSNRHLAARAIADQLPAWLSQIRSGATALTVERMLLIRLRRIDAGRCAADLLEFVVRERRHQALLDHALVLFAGWLDEHRDLIGEKFGEASRLTSRFFDVYVSNRFVDGIQSMLREIVDHPDHEVRRRLDLAMRSLIADLRLPERASGRAQRLWGRLLRRLHASHAIATEWHRLISDIAEDCRATDSRSVSIIADMIGEFAGQVSTDQALRRQMERSILENLERLLEQNHREVGRLIASVISSWDGDFVVHKVESHIGRDLQFIRINGSLVGGLVGLLIHLVTVIAVA